MAGAFDSIMKPLQQKGVSDAGVLQSIAAMKKAPGASASQLGAALAESEGEKQIAQAGAAAQQMASVGEQDLASQQLDLQKAESARNIALSRLSDKNEARLASLNNEVANNIAQASREFTVDSANRKYMNQQMLDQYAAEELVADEAKQNYIQNKELAMNRKVQLMDAYSKRIQQALEQGFLKERGELDQISREKLARLAAAFERKMK
jgi:hypothetical protein